MNRIISLYNKYKEIVNYLVVGFLTTLVTIVSYFIISNMVNIDDNFWFLFANVFSWILAVIFAYVMNKFFVFESKCKNKKEMGYEIIKFFSSRVTTLIMEIVVMFLFVKVLLLSNGFSKIIAQIMVIITNYVLSKIFVFKKNDNK